MLTLIILVRFIYYPRNGQPEMIFTLIIMGMVIFLVGTLLDKVNLGVGFAIGLFAIFGIIRFRTPPVEPKDLSYLFLVVGIAIINSLVDDETYDIFVALTVNIIVLPITYFAEIYTPKKHITREVMTYITEDLEIVNNKARLLEEIRKTTNINVFKVDVKKINASKRELTLWVYHKN